MKTTNSKLVGAANLSVLGHLMFYGAIVVVIICRVNCCVDNHTIKEHPIVTVLSGGKNLSGFGYTFLPPWSPFEASILIVGAIGWLLKEYFPKLGRVGRQQDTMESGADGGKDTSATVGEKKACPKCGIQADAGSDGIYRCCGESFR